MDEMQTTRFKSLRIEGWRQFEKVDIELHPRLTVLTGANGAGKSTLIQVFSRHFGFYRHFLGTPSINETGLLEYVTGIFDRILRGITGTRNNQYSIGEMTYSNGNTSKLLVPISGATQYDIGFAGMQEVYGLHVDSHLAISNYQTVGNIPSNLTTAEAVFTSYNNEIINKYQGGHTGYSPIYRMKEAIISMAIFGEGNSRVQPNPTLLRLYDGFVQSLRTILPESLGFINLSIRPPEVVIVTKTGEFLIDAASGGIRALIDLTYRLQMYSAVHESFVATIDEPENHLHPTMQRSLMRRLLSAYPKAQFIIATHSPFMVSSVRDSYVYVLRYKAGSDFPHRSGKSELGLGSSRVVSEKLDTVNKAGSANEILREVLGVSATIPEWVEDGLKNIINNYRSRTISPAMLRDLRGDLSSLGYEELYPEALAELTVGK